MSARFQAHRIEPCHCPVCAADRILKFVGLVIAAALFVAGTWGVLVFVLAVWGPA